MGKEQTDNMKKMSWFLLTILLICSSCAANPDSVMENGVSRAEASKESVSSETGEPAEQTQENIGEILSSTPQEIKKQYSTENTVINIDAEVMVPKVEQIYTGKIKWLETADTDAILQKILTDDQSGQSADNYTLSIASEIPGALYYENRTISEMYPDNVEPAESEKPEISITSEEAIAAVEDLLSLMGVGEYSTESPHLQINHGGERDGAGLYRLWIAPKIYGVPLYLDIFESGGFAVNGQAYVSDDGVALVTGQLCVEAYDVEEVQTIISLEQAMDVLEQSLDLYVSGKPDNKVQTIALRYLTKVTEDGPVFVPCWCFEYEKMDLSVENEGQDICINAVTGQIER
jgi:hypothetical protein